MARKQIYLVSTWYVHVVVYGEFRSWQVTQCSSRFVVLSCSYAYLQKKVNFRDYHVIRVPAWQAPKLAPLYWRVLCGENFWLVPISSPLQWLCSIVTKGAFDWRYSGIRIKEITSRFFCGGNVWRYIHNILIGNDAEIFLSIQIESKGVICLSKPSHSYFLTRSIERTLSLLYIRRWLFIRSLSVSPILTVS